MKSEAKIVPRDESQAVPIADVRDVPLDQLAADTGVHGMVNRMLGSAAGLPRAPMFNSAI